MKTGVSRAERLLQIESIILSRPGIRRSELSTRLGVHRSTIGRDINEISVLYPLTEDDEGGLTFFDGYSLDSITFSSYEAVYVYLACKLITDTLDRHSPYAASAIRKLGAAIQKVSPSLSKVMIHDADKLDGNRQIVDKTFLSALEGLTQAWIKHELVRLEYNSPTHKEIRLYDVGIISILPNRLGGTFVVLTYQKHEKKLRLFRIDRIKSVTSQKQKFEIPDNLEVERKLSEAWSIWFKEGNPVPVKLKFSSRVAGRVRESQWHTSQEISDLDNGGVLVVFEISEPEEMYPWIRGWGMDVEILEPEYLRQRFIEEIKEMYKIYGI
ncbi:MAG: WYL domain-containing protein [Bacteroidetes bacterium]|nr:WYL domain-containing protein [Bacteroidota bacterium]